MAGTEDDGVIDWTAEAEAVIEDVKQFVKEIVISERIQPLRTGIFINVTTEENEKFCVEFCSQGFRVAGHSYDEVTDNSDIWYETPYSLLSTISPQYCLLFGNSLMQKLSDLQKSQENQD
ncbi:hypothetical protein LSTR_LSTR005569 [Laodelphax striatellus]|uniref:GSKIP domain-containing protein n=1 Tax=Laodelphax striatellus TaxID=195883 RepID=A0A482WXI3_LAOST|nr:hypothetical protein LSTR_LSTR005569 [Laodelphax striatellus]